MFLLTKLVGNVLRVGLVKSVEDNLIYLHQLSKVLFQFLWYSQSLAQYADLGAR